MRDTRQATLATIRARAEEIVAGWLTGTAPDRPPADILRIEVLDDPQESTICFCAGCFCWPATGLIAPA